MKTVVVDTNVPMAANRGSHASRQCAAACARRLAQVMQGGSVALDRGWAILREYRNVLGARDAHGPGRDFHEWLLRHLRHPDRCVWVDITPRESDRGEDYHELPAHEGLARFDPSDRKFVAVARVANATILEALDPGYWHARRIFAEAGVDVEFLCPTDIQQAAGDHPATRKD